MSHDPSPTHSWWRDPRTREFLAWMLPALLVACALRVVLMVHLPFAYYHDDAPDFLTTPEKLLFEHKFELHTKKTFLVPIVFSVPFLIRIPALIAIPVFQHLLGLGVVLMVGLLCRLWFRHWRVFILPLTLLAAVNPFYLWYEHTLMAETIFVFTTLLLTLAGTLYTLEQSPRRFYFLLVALFLEAGARPEGKLLFGFAMLLVVLLHWRGWRSAWPRLAILVALAIGTNFITQTSQAGLLLYTSVARFTPTELKGAPGFDPYIAPIRADLNQRWDQRRTFPKVRDRRLVAGAVEQYLFDTEARGGKHAHHGVNAFCKKLALETCLKNFSYLPIHIYHKFRAVAVEPPSGWFDQNWLFERQRSAYEGALPRTLRLAHGLTGESITGEPELRHFFETRYGEVPWFNALQTHWLAVVNALHFPDLQLPNPEYPRVPLLHPGVPYYFLIAGIGLVVVMFRRDPLQAFHFAWGLTLLGFFYTIMLTANVRPRFRIVFEPFWFLYIALLAECLWLAMAAPFRRRG